MKATGITAEFDPLHNGHAYIMEEARKLTDCDAVVVAMSGDFVQRGGPAVTDKWTRTGAALASGADLVIEIPVMFCLGNASQYAGASVSLLESAGCTNIVFGSESGDTGLVETTAACIRDMGEELGKEISLLAKEGLSFPAARSRAYAALRQGRATEDDIAKELSVLREPNDILALEYVMNMKLARPLAVKRQGQPHSAGKAEEGRYQSATAVRDLLCERRRSGTDLFEGLSEWMPETSLDSLKEQPVTFSGDWTDVLRYAVMSSDPDLVEDCPSGGEGLGRLLKSAVHSEDSFDGIISAVKSKRYTYTRISRLCMQVILGMTRTKYPYTEPAYIRVLGFNDRGRELLSSLKKDGACMLPVITNINKEGHALCAEAGDMLGLDIHASDIYNLITGRELMYNSDNIKHPVIHVSGGDIR